jgi:hypothetical protein
VGAHGRPTRKADNLTAICEPIVYEMCELRRLTTLWAFMACYRDSLKVLQAFCLSQTAQKPFFSPVRLLSG